MFDVIEKATGKRLTVYATAGSSFLIEGDAGFVYRNISEFEPVRQKVTAAPDDAGSCVFSRTERKNFELDTLLARITSREILVELGDTITIRLLDETEVDLVVTDQNDKTVRFESRDCLGVNTSARELDSYLSEVYALLPDALKKRIVEVERVHLDSDGNKYPERCKLFVPAASEMFPPDERYDDEGLYQQLEWYKDVHNRVRADHKGGNSHWYWTGSAYSGNSSGFCFVNLNGSAGNSGASYTYGVAPFGCIISKT